MRVVVIKKINLFYSYYCMNISKQQLSMLPTYEGLNGQSVIGQGLIVKFTIEANSNS